MEKNQVCQSPLLLNDIWNNIFNKLCGIITGNDNKCDYFAIDQDEHKLQIIRVSNLENRWECMLEPGVAWHFKSKIKDGYGNYTQEFKKYISDLLSGHIKPTKKGNAARYTHLRYEDLLNYLVEKGDGTITREIDFIKNTVINSCMLKAYLEEKTKSSHVIDETQVLKSDLVLYKERFRIDFIEDFIRRYLSRYYRDLEGRNALEILAIVILRALCEVSVTGDGSGCRLKNERPITQLQTQLIQVIEDYLHNNAGEKPPEINVSLIAGWEDKWFVLRKSLMEEHHFSESTNLIKALDNTYRLRVHDIKRASLGLEFKDRLEINSVWRTLKEEMQQLDVLLEKLGRLRDAMSGLRERNTYEEQNETEEMIEEVISLHLKLKTSEENRE